MFSLLPSRNRTASTKIPPPVPISSPPLESTSPHPLSGSTVADGFDASSETVKEPDVPDVPRNSVDSDRSVTNSIPGPLPYKARQKHDRINSAGSVPVGAGATPGEGHGRTPSSSTNTNTSADKDKSQSIPGSFNPLMNLLSPSLGANQAHSSAKTSSSTSGNATSIPASSFPLPMFTTAPPPPSLSTTSGMTGTSTSFFTPTSATGTSSASISTTSTGLTSNSGSSHAAGHGSNNLSLTARLQLQSLKAGGQRMGLSNGSWGMKMLDALFEKVQLVGSVQAGVPNSGVGSEWQEIVRVVTGGGATLLLPSSPASGLPITTGWMRDHVLFVAPESAGARKEVGLGIDADGTGEGEKTVEKGQKASMGKRRLVVTMSGLVGYSDSESIVFESALSTESQMLHDLRDPTKRDSSLARLRPTTSPTSESYSYYPSFALGWTSTTLPFPLPSPVPAPSTAAFTSTTSAAPTGRSRSGSNASLASLQMIPAQAARLNPFASLFGHGSAGGSTTASTSGAMTPPRNSVASADSHPGSPEASAVVSPVSALGSVLASPQKGVTSIVDSVEEHTEGYQIPGWVTSSVVRYADVSKALSKALRKTVQEDLRDLPDKTTERVVKFALGSHPSQTDARASTGTSLLPSTPTNNDTFLKFVSAEELSHAMQSFLEAIYDELYAHNASAGIVPESPRALGLRRKGSIQLPSRSASGSASSPGGGVDPAKRKGRDRRAVEEQAEQLASDGTDLVESMLCEMFHNGLYRPPGSDDERHDEALSSRIAALNILDLSLDHLGVMVKDDDGGRLTGNEKLERDRVVKEGLDSIIGAVGRELQSLNSPDNGDPKTKETVMVNAHKLITDGLSELPKIRLRPDGEGFVPPDPVNSPPPSDQREPADANARGPPPLPPRPIPNPALPAEEKTPKPSQGDLEAPETPLPRLDLPDSAERSQLEEAMLGSIIEDGVLPNAMDSAEALEPQQILGGTTSGADLLLPIMIFAVVKANPSQLVSHLLFLQRYRCHVCQGGEASYAVVNTTAVVEFLENVDLAELGLSSSEKVLSVADLAPIGLNYLDSQHVDTQSIASASTRLRGRVLQVGEMAGSAAGSANKVLTGVVDSGWGALRTLIAPNLALPASAPVVDVSDPPVRPKNARKPSNFSLANVTASVASITGAGVQRERPRVTSSVTREMVDVSSRPSSIRELGDSATSEQDSSEDEEVLTDDEDHTAMQRRPSGDTQSIRSQSSRFDADRPERVSLSDRFANLVGPSGKLSTDRGGALSPGPESANRNSFLANLTAPRATGASRRTTILNPSSASEASIAHHEHQSARSIPLRMQVASTQAEVPPPIERFMTCDLADLRMSEIGELLRDYRRLANLLQQSS